MSLPLPQDSCARVWVVDPAGACVSRGSGFLLGPRTLATCWHVVDQVPDEGKIELYFPGLKEPCLAEVLDHDEASLGARSPLSRARLAQSALHYLSGRWAGLDGASGIGKGALNFLSALAVAWWHIRDTQILWAEFAVDAAGPAASSDDPSPVAGFVVGPPDA